MTSESDARHLAPLEHERLVLGATSAAVLRIDGQKAHWVAWTAASGGDAPTVPLSLGDPSPIADVVTEHRGQLFARVADEREAYPGWSAAGVDGPSAYVPIVVAGAVVGVLTASYPVAHVLRAHDVELLNSLAHRWGDRLVGVPGAPQNTVIGGASLWVMAGRKPEEYKGVAAFFDYLSKPEVAAASHKRTGYLPVTIPSFELTEKSGFYKENPGTDVSVTQMIRKTTDKSRGIRLGNFVQIRTIIDEEMEQVWNGKKTAKEALDSAVMRGNEQLERFEKANKSQA